MNKIKDWPWIPIMSWIVISIALINWIWPLITKDTAESAERKTQTIGRYKQVDSFYFKDGDSYKATIFKDRTTGNCVIISGKYHSQIMASIPCSGGDQ